MSLAIDKLVPEATGQLGVCPSDHPSKLYDCICEYGIKAITSGFQPDNVGSILTIRSWLKTAINVKIRPAIGVKVAANLWIGLVASTIVLHARAQEN